MTSDTLDPTWLDRSIFPFESRSVEIDGNRVHYIDEGRGPPLLMLHGNGSWAFLYRHIIPIVSARFRCIALDYPGFGLSKARVGYSYKPEEHSRIVEGFADKLDLRDIRLMVQDWGGPIGLGFAGRRPELIHSPFICNTWAWPAQDTPHIASFAKVAGSALARFLITKLNLFPKLLVPAAISRKLTKAERRAYEGPFPTPASRYPLALFPREILAARDYLARVEAKLTSLHDRPALLLWGDADPAFRAGERARFEAAFPRHRTVILPGAKHYVQEDAPAEIGAAILAFDEAQ